MFKEKELDERATTEESSVVQTEGARKVTRSVQPHVALDIDRAAIEAFCRKWRIKELALFGSILTDEFRPDSDVDFLVSFDEPEPDWGPWMGRWQDMAEELESIVGRKIDLVDKKGVERSRNYIKRRHILEHQSTIYVAG